MTKLEAKSIGWSFLPITKNIYKNQYKKPQTKTIAISTPKNPKIKNNQNSISRS